MSLFLMFVFAVINNRAEARLYLHSVRGSIHTPENAGCAPSWRIRPR